MTARAHGRVAVAYCLGLAVGVALTLAAVADAPRPCLLPRADAPTTAGGVTGTDAAQ